MLPSEHITIAVSVSQGVNANTIAASMDYESESLGAFFLKFSDGNASNDVYIAELYVRPTTHQAIKDAVTSGTAPSTLQVFENTTADDVAATLGVIYVPE